MTGCDSSAIRELPYTSGLRSRVAMHIGHLVDYGAPMDQTIRLSGAEIRSFGASTEASAQDLRTAICDDTCAGVYVVSHHCVQRGQLPLSDFITECHRASIPVIVDAASEYDLKEFIALGADLVVYSAQKFLAGPTAGIIAGRRDLVRSCFLHQRLGIGRPMKAGKEAVAGSIAALEVWSERDSEKVRRDEQQRVNHWLDELAADGLPVVVSPDPTGNPITRVRVPIDPDRCGCAAWDVARELGLGDPMVVVRCDGVNLGFFELDPCNLNFKQAHVVTERIRDVIARARRGEVEHTSYGVWSSATWNALKHWPY